MKGKIIALILVGLLAGSVAAKPCPDGDTDCLIDRVNEATYRNNHPIASHASLFGGLASTAVAVWAYQSGRKTTAHAPRDFCRAMTILFGIKAVIKFGGGE